MDREQDERIQEAMALPLGTPKEVFMEACKLGGAEGSVRIQFALANGISVRDIVLAANEFKTEDGEIREDAPPEVAEFLEGLRRSLLGES